MHEVESANYLGNFITSQGGVRATVEDRRSKGWGRVSQVMGILGEVALGRHRMEAGLILRTFFDVAHLLGHLRTPLGRGHSLRDAGRGGSCGNVLHVLWPFASGS